jgi:hypothetical protein
MFIKILFNYRGEQTHFKGERTQVECVVRANGLDTRFDLTAQCNTNSIPCLPTMKTPLNVIQTAYHVYLQ